MFYYVSVKYYLPWTYSAVLKTVMRCTRPYYDSGIENVQGDEAPPLERMPGPLISSLVFWNKPASEIEVKTFLIPTRDGKQRTAYYFKKNHFASEKQSSSVIKSQSGGSPLIIFFHGGGWISGNMEFYNALCTHIADFTDADVLSVDYRLAPTFRYPIAQEDCFDTLVWAWEGLRYLKVDAEKVFLMGEGTGGTLAAIVAREVRDSFQSTGIKLAGEILISPLVDGRMNNYAYELYGDSPTLTLKDIATYITSYANESKDTLNSDFSPLLSRDHSRLPDTLIISAQKDPLSGDASAYAKVLEDADNNVKLIECPGAVHGLLYSRHAPGNAQTEGAIAQFVKGVPLENVKPISIAQWETSKKSRQRKGLLNIEVE